MKAYEYCKNAATTMEQRGKENGYDNAKEERSAKQIDTTAAQFDSLKGWPIASAGTWHPSLSVGKLVNAANFGVVAQDVQPMVVLTGEDGSKICMTQEDFRNMEKTLVTGALK